MISQFPQDAKESATLGPRKSNKNKRNNPVRTTFCCGYQGSARSTGSCTTIRGRFPHFCPLQKNYSHFFFGAFGSAAGSEKKNGDASQFPTFKDVWLQEKLGLKKKKTDLGAAAPFFSSGFGIPLIPLKRCPLLGI